MKKKLLIVLSALLAIILVVSIYVYFRFFNYDEKIKLDENTRIIITYTNGNNASVPFPVPERGELFQIDNNGEVAGFTAVNSVINPYAINYENGLLEIFTNDNVYYASKDGKTETINNPDLKGEYSLANKNGRDFVNDYAYIEKYDTSVRVVPHGLAYAIEEKVFFDLLVFSNEEEVYNIEVGSVNYRGMTIDQESGDIILVETRPMGEDSNIPIDYIPYHILSYNEDTQRYETNRYVNVPYEGSEIPEIVEGRKQEDGLYVASVDAYFHNGFLYSIQSVTDQEAMKYGGRYIEKIDLKEEKIVSTRKIDASEDRINHAFMYYYEIDGTIYMFSELIDKDEYYYDTYNIETNVYEEYKIDFFEENEYIDECEEASSCGVYFKLSNNKIYAFQFNSETQKGTIIDFDYQNNETHGVVLNFDIPDVKGIEYAFFSDFEVIED